MSKFSKLLENTFEKANLRKVRLKIDPLYRDSDDFSKFEGYNGYVIAENDKTMKVYFENEGGTIIDVPIPMIDFESTLSTFEKLKLSAITYLKTDKGIDSNNKLIEVILATGCVDDMILLLTNNCCDDKDIINILKSQYEQV